MPTPRRYDPADVADRARTAVAENRRYGNRRRSRAWTPSRDAEPIEISAAPALPTLPNQAFDDAEAAFTNTADPSMLENLDGAASSADPTPVDDLAAWSPGGASPFADAATEPAPVAPADDPTTPAADDDMGPIGDGGAWAVMLMTFSGENGAAEAAAALPQLRQEYPEFGGDLRIKELPSGAVIVTGQFDGPKDPAAEPVLARIQKITRNGAAPFARAHLVPDRQSNVRAALDPLNLLSVRRQYPNIDPLYTLQVAVWGDYDSGQFTMDQIARRARTEAQRLRAQGYDAYVHHTPEQMLSAITIGVFTSEDYDHQAGIFSSRVTALVKAFPHQLVNGEPLDVPKYARFPERGTKRLAPQLVEVPDLR